MTNAEKQMRLAFCKDLCDELVVKGDAPLVYPQWALMLSTQMIRLGWTKPEEEA